ncbi:hypothetical protein H9P43_008708 [Blastocladiella emersonii ATCC 22665]|nr:hypothetical protein H9P43_008708 [Blastocladiella emersonii ATCC 22665]
MYRARLLHRAAAARPWLAGAAAAAVTRPAVARVVAARKVAAAPQAYYASLSAASSPAAAPAEAPAAEAPVAAPLADPTTPMHVEVAAALDRILALPELSTKWSRRLAFAAERDWDGPLKVLVVADRHVGRAALVNALLGYPDGRAAVDETWGADFADTIRITKGDAWAEETVDGGIRRIKVPHSPLLADAELTLAPALPHVTNVSDLNTLATKHDLVLVVTDTPRHLSTAREELFVAAHRDRRPLVVAVNGTDYLANEAVELPRILAAVRARVPHADAVFPVSTRRAAVAQYLSSATSDGDSGVPALAEHLRRTAAAGPARAQLKYRSALATARDALDHLDAQLATAGDRLAALDRAFQRRVTDRVLGDQRRLLTEFHDRDLRAVADAVARIQASIRGFFDATPFWKLFWHADGVGAALRAHLRSHLLSEAEARMAFASGRLGEGLRYLYAGVEATVAELHRGGEAAPTAAGTAWPAADSVSAAASAKSEESTASVAATEAAATDSEPLAAPAPEIVDPALEPMLTFLDRMQDLVARDAAAHANVDPFALSNVVWRFRAQFEQGDYADHVRAHAESLVLRTAAAQGAAVVGTLLAVVNGIDPALAVPAGVVGSAASLAWMRGEWGKFEDKYIKLTGELQDAMRADLLGAYHGLVNDKLTVPMSNLVDVYDQAVRDNAEHIDARRAEVAKVRAVVDGLIKRIDA